MRFEIIFLTLEWFTVEKRRSGARQERNSHFVKGVIFEHKFPQLFVGIVERLPRPRPTLGSHGRHGVVETYGPAILGVFVREGREMRLGTVFLGYPDTYGGHGKFL